MPVLTLPYSFVNGTTADATQVDADFNATVAVVNALDHFNVGSAGFYASQIIPTSTAQATFGGTLGFVMPFGLSLGASNYIRLEGANGVGNLFWNGGNAFLCAGAHFNGSNWVADATSAWILDLGAGVPGTDILSITFDTGLTIGSTYVPTTIFAVDESGNVYLPSLARVQSASDASNIQFDAGSVLLQSGCFYNGTNFIATVSEAIILALNTSGQVLQVFENTGLTPNNPFTPTLRMNLGLSSPLGAQNGLQSGDTTAFGSAIYSGNGVPSGGLGTNGDFYLRQNGGASSHIYFKSGGTWAAIV